MKKLISLMLALALMLSLCACGGSEAETPEVTDEDLMGTTEGNVYTNEAMGVRFELDEGWTVFTQEQLAELSGITAAVINDEALAKQLEESGTVHSFYATSNEGMYNLGIVWEDLGALYGKVIDEESYVEIGIGQLPEAMESAGLENVTAEPTTISFAGQDHAAIVVTGEIMGVGFYETLVCVKVGDYMAVITAASYMDNATGQILAMASGI